MMNLQLIPISRSVPTVVIIMIPPVSVQKCPFSYGFCSSPAGANHIVVGSNDVPPDMEEKVPFFIKKTMVFEKIPRTISSRLFRVRKKQTYFVTSTSRDLFISGVYCDDGDD